MWAQSNYEAWDQSIPAGASLKVGYALGAPDWGKIDKVLGDSWGSLYVVELEVEIDGEFRRIVSPKIPRDEA